MLYLYDLLNNFWFNSAIMFASFGVMNIKKNNVKVVDIKKYTDTNFVKSYDHKADFVKFFKLLDMD